MDEQTKQSAFMNALVTEHFVLQSAASTTVSEAAGRATLYMTTLSSAVVAMGFVTRSPGMLAPFAATVIPTVFIMGVFTTVRLVDTGVQNLTFLAGIARIRGYYRGLESSDDSHFTPWGQTSNEATQALSALAVKRSRLLGFGTTASMIATVNGILAGVGVALLGTALLGRDHTWLDVLAGILATATCLTAFYRYQDKRYRTLDTPSQ
ncbi:hypothetical protein [Actinoallomurus sp. NPDC050550]|uniref:hypothetical protein n=1 Tax=Actinoallomurus sp. NPDC050550 TaxID=3154937 RepID=UPI0033C87E73